MSLFLVASGAINRSEVETLLSAKRPLQVIGVDGDIRIGEEDLEADPPLAYIVQRLDKGVRGREALALKLPIDPVWTDLWS